MSSSEDCEQPEEDKEAPVHDYIELKTKEEVKALTPIQACAYIEKLHEIIRKYDKKIAVYKQKLKAFVRGVIYQTYFITNPIPIADGSRIQELR